LQRLTDAYIPTGAGEQESIDRKERANIAGSSAAVKQVAFASTINAASLDYCT
jgi:hypothetical protein